MTKAPLQNILAFDTALGGVSVCVLKGDEAFVRQVETLRDQASMLVPLINEALDEAEIAYKDLHKVVTTVGPGSFTGLRIGLSTARSLGFALNIPCVGVQTLHIAAREAISGKPALSDKPVLSVLETKRQDFYVQSFDVQGTPTCEPLALNAADLEAQFTGDAYHLVTDTPDRFKDEMSQEWYGRYISECSAIKLLNPQKIACLGKEFLPEGHPANPLYLRDADVSMPKTQPRKLKSI